MIENGKAIVGISDWPDTRAQFRTLATGSMGSRSIVSDPIDPLPHRSDFSHAKRLERQHEAPHEREARLNRASLYAAAAVNGTTLTPAIEGKAIVDLVTADYLERVDKAAREALAIIAGLATLAELRDFDPRTAVAWPMAPA